MIKLEVEYKKNKRGITVYNEWDVDHRKVVKNANEATKEDVGKFYKFPDGSGWYSKICGVNRYAVRTELCTVRKKDYLHCARVKYPYTNYSGAFKTEEHELVRPFNKMEKRLVNRLKRGQKIKYLTKRLRVLTIKKLQNQMQKLGIDERKIAELLLNAAKKGNQKIQAIDRLAYLGGVKLEPEPNQDSKKRPLFQQINNNMTIQQQRRAEIQHVPTGKQIKEAVEVVNEEEGVEVDKLQYEHEA